MKRAIPLFGLLACLHAGAQSPAQDVPSAAVAAAAARAKATKASGAQQFTLKNGMQLIF